MRPPAGAWGVPVKRSGKVGDERLPWLGNQAATRQAASQPSLRQQYHQGRRNQPSPQLLLVLQFGNVQAAFLLGLGGQVHLTRLQRNAKSREFLGGQRRGPAFGRVEVDREAHRRLQRSDGVDARQVGLRK